MKTELRGAQNSFHGVGPGFRRDAHSPTHWRQVSHEKIRSRCGAAGGRRVFEASDNISAASVYSLRAIAPMLGIDGLIGATAETSPCAAGNFGAPLLAVMPGRSVVEIPDEPAFGCAAGGIRFDEAVEHVLSLAPSTFRTETVPLVDCAGRVIAAPFEARVDLPGFDRSAIDGYAVSCADLKTGAWLPTIGRTAAGEAPGRLCPNSAHRIMTGAPVLDGADAVIAQENVYQRGSIRQIGAVPPVGSNVRRRSEDIRTDKGSLPKGPRWDWRHIAVLAAQGVQYVSVLRRPRGTLLSSGRELRGERESLAPGEIHGSNLPMLAALVHAGGAVVRTMAVVEGDVAAMRSSLRHAAIDADLVLTTAGISVGEEDYVRDALRDLGADLAVHKVAMKPGKPLAFGRFEDAVFIGLPGNPSAALAGAIGFVRPLLARMGGAGAPAPIHARAGFEIRRKSGRTEFVPVCLRQRNACIWAERGGLDGSARLLLQASGFVVLSEEDTDVHHGDLLCVFPFLPSDIEPGGEISEMHRRNL
jgi:molybdopterin molybdotransferase